MLTFADLTVARRPRPDEPQQPVRRFAVSDWDSLDPDWRAKARAAGHYLVD